MPSDPYAPSNKIPEIRAGDTVVVLTGKDAGKRGKVDKVVRNPATREKRKLGWRRVSARGEAVVIGGLNIVKRHQKARMRSGGGRTAQQVQQGGIIDVPAPIDISNVMIVCPHCDRVTRVKHETLGTGQRVRLCRHCNEQLEAVR